ncbi:MAG: Mbeg1-like protein [Ruminococcus callidus]
MKTTYDANILTYCQWRDDLTMQQSPFCHVDNLIFCCLSYLNWDGIAEGFTAAESISLRDAARLWEHRPTAEQKVRVETDRNLLRQTAASRRFGEVRLFRYAEQFSETRQQQFSATAFLLDSDTVYVAFRGTDNTLTGWREDFNLSFLPYVPSQAAAAAYLRGILSLQDFPTSMWADTPKAAIWQFMQPSRCSRKTFRGFVQSITMTDQAL